MKNNRLKGLIRWTIAVLCIAYIVLFFWRRREQVELAFSLNPALILLVLIFISITYLLNSYRYRFIIEKCGESCIPYWRWFQIFILGLFLNNFAPQMGNVYRGVRLKKDYQVSYTRYVSAYISFAWMDTCLNMVIAAVVIVIVDPGLQIAKINVVVLLAGLAVTIALVPVVVLRGCRLFESKIRRPFWIHSKLSEVFEVTVSNLRDLRYVVNVMVFGLITSVEMCLMFYVCFRCFDLDLTLPAIVLFYTLFKLNSYLAITPGNLGIRELAYGILSEQMHIGMAEGILVSAVFRILTYIVLFTIALPLGGLDLLRHREQYRTQNSENS